MALWLLDDEVEEEEQEWPYDGPVFGDCAMCGRAFVAHNRENECPDCSGKEGDGEDLEE